MQSLCEPPPKLGAIEQLNVSCNAQLSAYEGVLRWIVRNVAFARSASFRTPDAVVQRTNHAGVHTIVAIPSVFGFLFRRAKSGSLWRVAVWHQRGCWRPRGWRCRRRWIRKFHRAQRWLYTHQPVVILSRWASASIHKRRRRRKRRCVARCVDWMDSGLIRRSVVTNHRRRRRR